jgi:glycosyltransferase involved in cell wall biosynthesis
MSYIIVIIPAYQPEVNLLNLVKEVIDSGFNKIIIIDDGSSKDKQHIFDALSILPEVEVLRHAVNLGKGAALKTAFNHVLLTYPDSAGVVTADADGQHLVIDIKVVADTLLHSKSIDTVLGVREFDSRLVPFRSRFGNTVTISIFRFLTGVHIKDTQTGLRCLRLKVLPELLKINTQGYEFELNVLLHIVQKKYSLEQVGITTVYEPGNPTSHFNPLMDSMRIYFVFIRFCASGLATYLADLVVFAILNGLGFSLFASVAVGRFAGALVSFSLLRKFVFLATEKISKEIIKFSAVWLVFLLLSYGSIYFMINELGMNVFVSRIAIDVLFFLFNFSIQREFVFRQNPATNNGDIA